MSDMLAELTEMTFALANQRPVPAPLKDSLKASEATGKWLALTLHKSLGTFCVRGLRCESREFFLQQLSLRDEVLLRQMKWEDEDLDGDLSLFFMQAPDATCADDVLQQLCQRRFPLFDQNFAGPLESGQTWWMSTEGETLSLIFRSLGSLGFRRVMLGPVGMGLTLVKDLLPYARDIQGIFNLEHFSLSERGCEIKFFSGHEETQKMWQQYLLEGKMHPYFDFCDQEFAKGLFQKIAFRRRFWITIESELKEMLQ